LVISLSTLVINLVVKIVAVYLISLIRIDTESLQASFITILVFLSYYFNTGWLIILADANMKGQGYYLERLFTGRLSDFSMDWYRKEGHILTQTMLINAFVPAITDLSLMAVRALMRYKDKKFSKNGLTSCTSRQQYIELYSGPEFLMHVRYSYLMNTIFVTMMFGTTLPILFPIAFLSIFLVTLFENFMLFYVYRLPISYDGTLHKTVLRYMKYASLVSFAFNFWQISNQGLLNYKIYDEDEQIA
jgi:hypothetical protein